MVESEFYSTDKHGNIKKILFWAVHWNFIMARLIFT